MRYFLAGALFAIVLGVVLVPVATAQFTDVGGVADVQEGSGVGSDGLAKANIDLNGAYTLILDADADTTLQSNVVDDTMTFTSGGNNLMSLSPSRLAIPHHIRISDQKMLNVGSGDDFWHMYDETTDDDYEFWSTNVDAGTTDGIVWRVESGDAEVIFLDGIKPGGFAADPCAALEVGAIFYNTTANEMCFCGAASADLRMKDATTACF